jgi:Cu2+-exporting ATPase
MSESVRMEQGETVQIVHHLRGRLRLRLAGPWHQPCWQQTVRSHLADLPVIATLRINPWAQSVIVQYNPDRVSANTVLSQVQQQILALLSNDPGLKQQDVTPNSSSHPAEPQSPVLPPGISRLTPAPDHAEENWDGALLLNPFTHPDPWLRLFFPLVGLGLATIVTPLDWAFAPLVLGGITLAAALPLLQRTRQDLRQGRLDEDLLETLWTLFYGATGDFIAPNLDLLLAEFGDVLQTAVSPPPPQRQPPPLPWPETVQVIRKGKPKTIALSKVRPKDVLCLNDGDLCPADGIIVIGEAWLDMSLLTGEPAPIPRSPGKTILAGCTVMEGQIQVKVKRPQVKAQYVKELNLAESAPMQQTQVSNYAKSVGQTLVLPTLALSGGLFLWTGSMDRALALLQLDLLTGIRFSAPTTILATLHRAKQQQIYIRSGWVIETLTQADTVIFGRTGTLTQDRLTVVQVDPSPTFNPDKISGLTGQTADRALVALAAGAEQCEQSPLHPVGQAILHYAQALDLPLLPNQVCYPKTRYGLGVTAQVCDRTIVVGSRNYLQQAGITDLALPPDQSGGQDGQHRGYWYVYVAVDGDFIGKILCCAAVRPESKLVIAALQQRGIRVHMATGGSLATAAHVAQQIGLSKKHVHAELSPQGKKKLVRRLQKKGHTVVYMGEGMDDYPALCYADVAVGTHRSCPAIYDGADLRLPYGQLLSLIVAWDLAEISLQIIRQNIALVALPNLGITTLGVLLILDPILVVTLNNTVNVLAMLNALRPLWYTPAAQPESLASPTLRLSPA